MTKVRLLARHPGLGPAPFLCRSKYSFKPAFVRRQPDFSNSMLNGVDADYKSR
jgi:hypothetical protein